MPTSTVIPEHALRAASPRDGEDGMPHLASPVLRGRQALAAHFLHGCEHVVEIGGYRTPITPFLTHAPKSVLSMDPKMEPYEADTLHGHPCRVRHLACKFQQTDFDLEPFTYGLVFLGYSLKGYGDAPPDTDPLFELIDRAKRVVIDHVVDFGRARDQLPRVVGRGTLREVCSIDLTFHDEVIEGLPYSNRRMLVFEPLRS